MNYKEKILVGGRALIALGSSRNTLDSDYLINDESSKEIFIHDKENNIDYLNANGHKLFKIIYEKEKGNFIASPQSILELKAFAFVQHCLNGKWQKADDAEYDIRFLVRNFDLKELKIANKFLQEGPLAEVEKIIETVRK